MWRPRDSTVIIAHRGASADHPENTVEAFAAAALEGAHGIELDVRLSADGELVVHHDARYFDGRVVTEVPAADRPGGIPTLSEAMDAAGPCWVNVEIKNLRHEPGFDEAEATAAAVAGWWQGTEPGPPILVSAFSPASLAVVHDLEPRLPTAILLLRVGSDPETCAERARADGHVAIHPHDSATTPELVRAAHEAGLAVHTWTVDAPHRIAELAAMGVDGVVTNTPAAALQVLTGP